MQSQLAAIQRECNLAFSLFSFYEKKKDFLRQFVTIHRALTQNHVFRDYYIFEKHTKGHYDSKIYQI
jgi:hypothetical protein